MTDGFFIDSCWFRLLGVLSQLRISLNKEKGENNFRIIKKKV